MATKATPAKIDLPRCLCGCGEHRNPKRAYRPGHDARHAGAVGRAVAALGRDTVLPVDDADPTSPYSTLPTGALVAKARKVAETALTKTEAKVARAKVAA